MVNSKMFSSLWVIRIAVINYLNGNSFASSAVRAKICPINFSCLNPRFPSPYNLTFDLYWLNHKRNFVTVEPRYCFLHLLKVNRQITFIYYCIQTWHLCDTFLLLHLFELYCSDIKHYIHHSWCYHIYISYFPHH